MQFMFTSQTVTFEPCIMYRCMQAAACLRYMSCYTLKSINENVLGIHRNMYQWIGYILSYILVLVAARQHAYSRSNHQVQVMFTSETITFEPCFMYRCMQAAACLRYMSCYTLKSINKNVLKIHRNRYQWIGYILSYILV